MRGQTLARRTFWWDRTTDVEVDPLGAVMFDLDAMAEVGDDGELAPRSGLIDLVMSLFVAGVWVGVVSTGRRAWVEPLVRELIGDGLVETIVTADDTDSTEDADLYELALWEFGIKPGSALAVVGSAEGACALLRLSGVLATELVCTDYDHLGSTASLALRGLPAPAPPLVDRPQASRSLACFVASR